MKIPVDEMANLIPRACACQRTVTTRIPPAPGLDLQPRMASRVSLRSPQELRGRRSLRLLDHVVNRSRKILNARAGHDDRVTATVRFLGNAKEFAAVVFAEFDMEMLALNLQLPGLYEVIHCNQKTAEFRQVTPRKKSRFLGQNAPCEYLVDKC